MESFKYSDEKNTDPTLVVELLSWFTQTRLLPGRYVQAYRQKRKSLAYEPNLSVLGQGSVTFRVGTVKNYNLQNFKVSKFLKSHKIFSYQQ